MARFSQVPQTRNSLWLLHSFSTNCVKKQQNPASGNMFPFLVLGCVVIISVNVSITYRQAKKLHIQIRNSWMFVTPRAFLPQLFLYLNNYINTWGISEKYFCRSIIVPTFGGCSVPIQSCFSSAQSRSRLPPKLVCKPKCYEIQLLVRVCTPTTEIQISFAFLIPFVSTEVSIPHSFFHEISAISVKFDINLQP